MRKYTHWLVVDRLQEDDKQQIKNIVEYLKKFEGASATIYFRDSGSFEWIVKLVCFECYNELQIDVNSSSTGLRRLFSKPKNIHESNKTFNEMCKNIGI